MAGVFGAVRAWFSAAERSWHDDRRVRQFTADDLFAFSLAFDLPIGWFLMPPAETAEGRKLDAVGVSGAPTAGDPMALLDLLFWNEPLTARVAELIGNEKRRGEYVPKIWRRREREILESAYRYAETLAAGELRTVLDLEQRLVEAANEIARFRMSFIGAARAGADELERVLEEESR